MYPELITAAITPFTQGGKAIDDDAFKGILKHLHQHASQGVLLFGTTGEAPTLSLEEKAHLLALTHEYRIVNTAPGLHIMAAINCNATAEACAQARYFTLEQGKHAAESLLVIVPFYNKPTQAGLVAHFSAIAEAVPNTPIVMYNIPGRTGIRMEATTMATLHARYPHQIIGVKQSVPCMDAFSELRSSLPPSFHIWSGEDSLSLPMLSLGAYGAISVSSHLVGTESLAMIQAFKAGDTALALALHHRMLPVFRGLFETTNPILAKACLAQLGLCQPDLRLPMLHEPAIHAPMAGRILASLNKMPTTV